MIHKELESNPTLKLELVKLSGIPGIKAENILALETGSRGYCFLVKDTVRGDIFCKIDDEIGNIKFPVRYQTDNLKRQEESLHFQNIITNANHPTVTAPIVLGTPDGQILKSIDSKINGHIVPKDLVGKKISFMEMVKGKHFETKLNCKAMG